MGERIIESASTALTKIEGVKYNAAKEAVFFKKPLLASEKWQGFIYVDLT
jgi:hypothetical protein